jgi:hypothetical protein
MCQAVSSHQAAPSNFTWHSYRQQTWPHSKILFPTFFLISQGVPNVYLEQAVRRWTQEQVVVVIHSHEQCIFRSKVGPIIEKSPIQPLVRVFSIFGINRRCRLRDVPTPSPYAIGAPSPRRWLLVPSFSLRRGQRPLCAARGEVMEELHRFLELLSGYLGHCSLSSPWLGPLPPLSMRMSVPGTAAVA